MHPTNQRAMVRQTQPTRRANPTQQIAHRASRFEPARHPPAPGAPVQSNLLYPKPLNLFPHFFFFFSFYSSLPPPFPIAVHNPLRRRHSWRGELSRFRPALVVRSPPPRGLRISVHSTFRPRRQARIGPLLPRCSRILLSTTLSPPPAASSSVPVTCFLSAQGLVCVVVPSGVGDTDSSSI
jgi:hypothetical protein